MAKVSVIMPVYNAEKYLRTALDGVTQQTFWDIEIVCLDNCSTDKSWDIITEYAKKDNRIRAEHQLHNVGQGNNVNRGLEMASGEYVAECDADDIPDLQMYEKLYSAAIENDADIVKCSFFDVWGERLNPRPQLPEWYEKPFRTMELDQGKRMNVLRTQPHLQSGIAKRGFLLKHNLKYRPDGVFEDTSLSFKIRTLAQRYTYIPECLYYYRRDNAGSGSATIRNMYGICEQYEEIEKFNREHSLHLDDEIAVMRYYSYAWNIGRMTSMDEKAEFLMNVLDDFKEAPMELFDRNEDYYSYKQMME